MATYPINDENPPTGAGYRPGDIVVCPQGSVVPRWKYVGDEQWVPANVVEFVENEVTGGSVFSDGTNTLTLPVGNTDLSGGTGGSTYPAVTIEHLPASTALAATVTPGGIVSRFGFGKQIGIDVAQAGGSGVSGDIQIAWTNDAGATFTNYSTIGIITAGGTSTITILMADALGIGFRVRLANVAGTLTSATAGISVRLS